MLTAPERCPTSRGLSGASSRTVAAVMELDEGETRLELWFADGYFVRWYAHRRGLVKTLHRLVKTLHRFDERARTSMAAAAQHETTTEPRICEGFSKRTMGLEPTTLSLGS